MLSANIIKWNPGIVGKFFLVFWKNVLFNWVQLSSQNLGMTYSMVSSIRDGDSKNIVVVKSSIVRVMGPGVSVWGLCRLPQVFYLHSMTWHMAAWDKMNAWDLRNFINIFLISFRGFSKNSFRWKKITGIAWAKRNIFQVDLNHFVTNIRPS